MNNAMKARIDAWLDKDYRLSFYERITLIKEAEELFENKTPAMKYAMAYRYILNNITVDYDMNHRLIGNVPEILLTDENRAEAKALFARWWDMPDEEFQRQAYFCYSMHKNKRDWIASRPPWMFSQGHMALDWENLITHGIQYFSDRLEKRLEDETDTVKCDYLNGLRICVESIRDYILRYAELAKNRGDFSRYKMLERIANNAPATLEDALQLIVLICVSIRKVLGFAALSLGRIDQYLLSFYKKDIEDGTLTRETALDLIEEFLFKDAEGGALVDHMSDESCETTSRIDVSGDDITYCIISGVDENGNSCTNDLSYIFIEAITELNMLKAPLMIVRYFNGIEKEFWLKVSQCMAKNASVFVYNDNTMIPAFIDYGVDPDDAANYAFFACNNPTIPKKMGSLRQIWFNLAIPLELALNRGVPFCETGKPRKKRDCEFPLKDRMLGMMESGYWGVDTGDIANVKNIEDLLELYRQQVAYLMSEYRKGVEADCIIEKNENAGRIRIEDAFLDGTVENAEDWVTGSVKYHPIMVQGGGLATVVDSLYAINKLVFQDGEMTLSQLVDILKSDFSSDKLLQRRLINKFDKFGNDVSEVDQYAKKVVDIFTNAIKEQNKRDYLNKFWPGISTLRDFTTEGKYVGATPNGRNAGEPLSENQSPSLGADTKGLTALLNSIANVPFNKITGGPLNIKIHPSIVSGADGVEKIAALFKTYMDMGGMQLQVSVVDANILRAAQTEPRKYKGLTVRVTGYNAYFTHMDEKAQNEIIYRTEHQGF